MKKGNMYKCGFRTSCASESGVVTVFGSSLLLSFDLSTSTSLQYVALSTLIFLLFPRNQGNSQSVHNFQSGVENDRGNPGVEKGLPLPLPPQNPYPRWG
jgi:hypothetical protein